jgi:hypothetical protein
VQIDSTIVRQQPASQDGGTALGGAACEWTQARPRAIRAGRRANVRLLFALDLLTLAAAFWFAYLLRFDFRIPTSEVHDALIQLSYVVLIQIATLILVGAYSFSGRTLRMTDITRLTGAACLAAVPVISMRLLLPDSFQGFRVPIAVVITDTLIGFGGVVQLRMLQHRRHRRLHARPTAGRDDTWRRLAAQTLAALWAPHPDRPIFIVGAPRSGKSTLEQLLGRHPDVVTWSEAPDIWDVDHLNRDVSHEWDADRATRRERRRLRGCFYWYAKLAGKRRFVNSHARNTLRIRFILRVFPDCKIVFVQRDPRAVVNAMVNKIASDPGRQRSPMGRYCRPPDFRAMLRDDLVEQTCLQWLGIIEEFEAQLRDLPPGRVLTVRSEELHRSPGAVLNHTLTYCALAAMPGVNRIPDFIPTNDSAWRADRTAAEIETMHRLLGRKLDAMGYPDPYGP